LTQCQRRRCCRLKFGLDETELSCRGCQLPTGACDLLFSAAVPWTGTAYHIAKYDLHSDEARRVFFT
jgi:hypothetical protein